MTAFNRRRFLMIAAATAALPTGARAAGTAAWRGMALGAGASMKISGLSRAEAAPIFTAVEQELSRLEQIFSLYRDDSEISRLNREGMLASPSPELLEVLTISASLHHASGGVFDPTVQPLWLALAKGANADELLAARDDVGWKHLEFDTTQIRFHGPAGRHALTLNGIAQGMVTDRIADLLKSRDLHNVLIDMGEIAALGMRDTQPWTVGIVNPDGALLQRLTLSDRAVATSAPEATHFGPNADKSHILGPSGQKPLRELVSVSAPKAVLADGLSTALCLIEPAQNATLLSKFPYAKIELEI